MDIKDLDQLHLEYFFKQFPVGQKALGQSSIFTVSDTPLSNAKILMNTSSYFNYFADISEVGSTTRYEFSEEQAKREREGFEKMSHKEMKDIGFDILRSCLDFLDNIQQPQKMSSINLNYLNIMRQKVSNDSILIMDKFTKSQLFGAESINNESKEHALNMDSTTYELPIVTLKRKLVHRQPDTHRFVYIIKKDLFNLHFYSTNAEYQKQIYLDVEETKNLLPIILDVEIKGFDYIYNQFLQNNLEDRLFISCSS